MKLNTPDGGSLRSRGSESGRTLSGLAAENAKTEITLSELAEILSRRRLPLIVMVSLGILIALAATVMMPVRYEASSRLTVDFGPAESSGVEALAQAAGVADPTTLQTQVGILQTDSMAWEVIRRLRLDQKPDALPHKFGIGPATCESPAGSSVDQIDAECRSILRDEFRKRLHVQAVPRTEIIEISYRSRSPYLAAEVVNTLASLYIDRNFQSKYQSAIKNNNWLSGQLQNVRSDAENSYQKLLEFQKQAGTVGPENGTNLQLAQLTGLSQQLIAAEGERIVQEARFKTAQTGDPEAMINITQGTMLQYLHAEQVALRNQYAELDAQFGDAYPKVIQIKAQLEKEQEAEQQELRRILPRRNAAHP